MKQYKFIFSIILIFYGTACKKDFLKIVDKTVLLKEGYAVDLETTGHFMNGIYNLLAIDYISGNQFPYPDIMSDNMKSQKTTIFAQAYNWTFSPIAASSTSGDPSFQWGQFYKIIRNCNFVIEKADEYKDQNELKANNIKGQALAIRAMMHFTLSNMFAQAYNFTSDASHLGIPYITSSDIEERVYRQTVKEVYDMMIADLKNAILLLPNNPTISREMMNNQSAKALLARVYLFKEDWMGAKNLSSQVLANAPIMTAIDYPAKLYTKQDNEALFRMPPGNSSDYASIFMGFYANSASPNFVATKDIAQLLNEYPSDKRKVWVKDTLGTLRIRKFPRGAIGLSTQPTSDYYQTLLRSSEMSLTAAEAYANLNMEDSARFYLNTIRVRANIVPLSNSDATGQALLEIIYKERRKEMFFDGLRMWYLKRWKKGVERIDTNNPNAQRMSYPSNKAVAAIPINEVSIGGLQQNTGY